MYRLYAQNIFNLNHWQINKTKEKKRAEFQFIVTRSKVHGKENDSRKSFSLLCKSLTVLNVCFYLYKWPVWLSHRRLMRTQTTYFCDIAACSLSKFIIKIQLKNHIISSTAPLYNLLQSAWPLICEGWWSMRVKHKAYFINNNILVSRYVANMKTFGFVPNER